MQSEYYPPEIKRSQELWKKFQKEFIFRYNKMIKSQQKEFIVKEVNESSFEPALHYFKLFLAEHHIIYTCKYYPDDDQDAGFHFPRPWYDFQFDNNQSFPAFLPTFVPKFENVKDYEKKL
jgi:hypothetical protein